MTRITNSDQVLMLLKAQLERAKKSGLKQKSLPAGTTEVKQGAVSRVRSMALQDSLSEPELSRALISGLLAEQFGDEIVNIAKFQNLVDQIMTYLIDHNEARELLAVANKELTSTNRL